MWELVTGTLDKIQGRDVTLAFIALLIFLGLLKIKNIKKERLFVVAMVTIFLILVIERSLMTLFGGG